MQTYKSNKPAPLPHPHHPCKETVVFADKVRRDTLVIDSTNFETYIGDVDTNKSLQNIPQSAKVVIIESTAMEDKTVVLDYVSGFEGDDLYIINKSGASFTIGETEITDQKVCHFSRISGEWYLFNVY